MEWRPGKPNKPHRFWDSDVAKWLEAACYSLITHPDSELAALVEEAVEIVKGGQQEDGYLNTYYTVVEPGKRWTNIAWSHEMYDCGHLLEAALAHATYSKSTKLLDPILKYVGRIRSIFGPGKDQLQGYPGHEELELALLKAHEYTGKKHLLDLAEFFLEERGQVRAGGHYFDIEATKRGEPPFVGPGRGPRYSYHQADLPIRDMKRLEGHSVRAMYWLTAVAQLARLNQDTTLETAVTHLWDTMTQKKMHVTGGLGAMQNTFSRTRLQHEGYLETCAAIGLVLFAHQMLLLHPRHPEYSNTLELALYNAVLVGISLDGKSFFYDNPLATLEKFASRSDWFEVSCCPPNVARLYNSLGKYIYTVSEDDVIFVHLYISSEAPLTLQNGTVVKIFMESDGPWYGGVKIRLESNSKKDIWIHLRKPLGARNFQISGTQTNAQGPQKVLLHCNTDTINIAFTYPITRIKSHPLNLDNVNSVAFSRGPFIYCAETIDNPHIPDLRAIRIPDTADFEEFEEREAFKNWAIQPVLLKTRHAKVVKGEDGSALENVTLTLIPLFLWANRGKSDMRVWLPKE